LFFDGKIGCQFYNEKSPNLCRFRSAKIGG
jgi:hypothetical protein